MTCRKWIHKICLRRSWMFSVYDLLP